MPQPLYPVGDLHVALEAVILVTALRAEPMTGDAFFAIRLQGYGDPVRVTYPNGEAGRAERERAELLTAVNAARELARPGPKANKMPGDGIGIRNQ